MKRFGSWVTYLNPARFPETKLGPLPVTALLATPPSPVLGTRSGQLGARWLEEETQCAA